MSIHRRTHPVGGVSILTGSGEPVQYNATGKAAGDVLFQSSPAPESRCNRIVLPVSDRAVLVSILTGSGEPVQF